MPRRSKSRTRRSTSKEDRSVGILTVGWVLAVLTTLICELGSVAAKFYVARIAPGAESMERLSELLMPAAAVIGFITLILTPVVVKSRRVPLPRGLVVFALVVGGVPLVLLFLQIPR